MNVVKEGICEFFLFLKNLIRILHISIFLIINNPKDWVKFFARLVRRLNEALAQFFVSYRVDGEDAVKTHDYFKSELIKLKRRTYGLHQILELRSDAKIIGFSILMNVDEEAEVFALEGLGFFASLTGKNQEVLIGCSHHRSVYSQLEQEVKKYAHVKLVDLNLKLVNSYEELSKQAKYSHLVLARLQDWPRPDLLYRLHSSLLLSVNPMGQILTVSEVGFYDHSNIDDLSRVSNFQASQLPYFFMKGTCHLLCLSKSNFSKVSGQGAESVFQMALEAHRLSLDLYTLPFELYQYRISSSDKDETKIKALSKFHSQSHLPLEWKSGEPTNSIYFPFKVNINSTPKLHIIVLYKDNADVTKKCAQHLLSQTYRSAHITFVDNQSTDSTIETYLLKLGIEVIRIDEPFNYSRLNNLGVELSTYKDGDAYLFLNNDVYLETNAVAEMIQWIEMPKVGVVGSLLNFEDGTIQHAGICIDKVKDNCVYWEHQDLGRTLDSAKRGRALRLVEAVTGACLLIRKDIFHEVEGWDEVNYPIAFSDTDLCRRVRKTGHMILYTPDSRGVHLESKTRGYSIIEDYECSSWLFWSTDGIGHKNERFIGHNYLDILDRH
jgi:GT2 family glycosyltransferase